MISPLFNILLIILTPLFVLICIPVFYYIYYRIKRYYEIRKLKKYKKILEKYIEEYKKNHPDE